MSKRETCERFDCEQRGAIHTALHQWFELNRRSFPWRRSRSAYRVWISEVMLQQTRAEQARPYYLRFMKQFPSLKALASASQQDVLKQWEGLGYYSRARKLHDAARCIVHDLGGRFPRTYDGLLALPGIGPYSAAAIGSLAFGLPHAVVDGNVIRVLSRLFCLGEKFDTSTGKRCFQTIADQLLDREQPGLHNEAMMELGAMVCLPKNPQCALCPLINFCKAYQTHRQHDYPCRSKRDKIPHVLVGAGVIVDRRGRILIAQRRQGDMLGGLWEFPGGKREADEGMRDCIQRELLEEMGIHVQVGAHLVTVKHAYSHFTMDLHAYWVCIIQGRPKAIECSAFKWVTRRTLADYPMSKADDHIRRLVQRCAVPPFS